MHSIISFNKYLFRTYYISDSLEKEMATYSSFLAWEVPWTEEPGRLYSPWGHKESDTTEQLTDTDTYVNNICVITITTMLGGQREMIIK